MMMWCTESQVRKCLGFCRSDICSSLAYESAEQKHKHCLTWDFLSALVMYLRRHEGWIRCPDQVEQDHHVHAVQIRARHISAGIVIRWKFWKQWYFHILMRKKSWPSSYWPAKNFWFCVLIWNIYGSPLNGQARLCWLFSQVCNKFHKTVLSISTKWQFVWWTTRQRVGPLHIDSFH